MLRHIHILFLASACLVGLSACVATDSPGPNVSNATPQSLLRSYKTAVFERDYASILGCLEPHLWKEAESMLAAYSDFTAKGAILERLLRDRYGRVKAQEFRNGALYQAFDRMFDGVFLWIGPGGQAGHGEEVIQSADVARVVVLGENVGIEATHYGSQWLLTFAPDRMSEHYLDAYQRTLEAVSEEYDHIIKGIRDGTVTERNVSGIVSGVDSVPRMSNGGVRSSPISK